MNMVNSKDLFLPQSEDSVLRMANGADLTTCGAILLIWSKPTQKTVSAPLKTDLAQERQ